MAPPPHGRLRLGRRAWVHVVATRRAPLSARLPSTATRATAVHARAQAAAAAGFAADRPAAPRGAAVQHRQKNAVESRRARRRCAPCGLYPPCPRTCAGVQSESGALMLLRPPIAIRAAPAGPAAARSRSASAAAMAMVLIAGFDPPSTVLTYGPRNPRSWPEVFSRRGITNPVCHPLMLNHQHPISRA